MQIQLSKLWTKLALKYLLIAQAEPITIQLDISAPTSMLYVILLMLQMEIV